MYAFKTNTVFILSLLCIGLFDQSQSLPNGCTFESSHWKESTDQIVCHRFDQFTLDFLIIKANTTDYEKLTQISSLHFHMTQPKLFDNRLEYESLIKTILSKESKIESVIFNNIKGFEIASFNSVYYLQKQTSYGNIGPVGLNFINIKLDFYSGDKLIRSCEEYLKERNDAKYSLLQAMKMSNVKFFKVTYKRPICSLAFNNINIQALYLYDLIDTIMKTNVVKFIDTKSGDDLVKNSMINYMQLYVDKINLDKSLLNRNIFKFIGSIDVFGELISIQNDLFNENDFGNLTKIELRIKEFKRLSHKQGIEWIRNMNKNISIDLNRNDSDYYYNSEMRFRFINLNQYEGYDTYQASQMIQTTIEEIFPDEDFCLYTKYPFKQVVVLLVDLFEKNVQKEATCTLLWLVQYNQKLYPYSNNRILGYLNNIYDYSNTNLGNITDLINDCKFQERLSKCDKSQFTSRSSKQTNKLSFPEVMFLWDFISIILLPLICIFGTVTNILVIVNVSKKENKTILKENQYAYMKLKSIANCGIFFVQILSLMNICQGESGIYCPDIHRLVPIQYFKIIFVELFGNYFRFISNLFYIAFLMNRLSLIGKDHSKFTKFMSETKVIHFSIFTLIVGFIINFVKVFRYRANFFEYNLDYPKTFAFEQDKLYHTLIIIFIVFNSICDLINGSVFLIFCLVIDICLVLRIKRTIEEKEKKAKSMKSVVEDKKKKENSDAINRAVLLVVLNSIINFTCKLPSTLISINEMILAINNYIIEKYVMQIGDFNQLILLQFACQTSNLCQAFERFSIDLFLLSLALDLFFYYNFDIKFKNSFLNIFFKKENKK